MGEGPIALIMAPTRELALQIHGEVLHCISYKNNQFYPDTAMSKYSAIRII
jgi:superfamily II DNA/RNA helicase